MQETKSKDIQPGYYWAMEKGESVFHYVVEVTGCSPFYRVDILADTKKHGIAYIRMDGDSLVFGPAISDPNSPK